MPKGIYPRKTSKRELRRLAQLARHPEINETWNAERIATLDRMWNDGFSAELISWEIGVSRNAVLGKANRLRLPARSLGVRQIHELRPENKRNREARAKRYLKDKGRLATREAKLAAKEAKVKLAILSRSNIPNVKPKISVAVIEPPIPVPPRNGARVTILDLNAFRCPWPIGEPGTKEFHYCGTEKLATCNYCFYHLRHSTRPG
jgi:GcrA cell cycle regulator